MLDYTSMRPVALTPGVACTMIHGLETEIRAPWLGNYTNKSLEMGPYSLLMVEVDLENILEMFGVKFTCRRYRCLKNRF
jgi:hypothetical protein